MELPHTAGCLVCGTQNPKGLRLSFHVDENGVVTADYTPSADDIGFEGIIHGGVLATVLDEAMVWAATWAGKRFCVAAEMSVRFKNSAKPGETLRVSTAVRSFRSRLIETTGEIHTASGVLIATAEGKYVPVSPERHQAVMATAVPAESTSQAAHILKEGIS